MQDRSIYFLESKLERLQMPPYASRPTSASEHACSTLTPPAGAAHVSFKFYPPPRFLTAAAPLLHLARTTRSSPTCRQRGGQHSHRFGAIPAIGNREDGRAATTETRRQGKDRPLHPRRHARSGNLRQSEELSHAFFCRCGFTAGRLWRFIKKDPWVIRALCVSLPFLPTALNLPAGQRGIDVARCFEGDGRMVSKRNYTWRIRPLQSQNFLQRRPPGLLTDIGVDRCKHRARTTSNERCTVTVLILMSQ